MQTITVILLAAVAVAVSALSEEQKLLGELKEVLERGLKNDFNSFTGTRKYGKGKRWACPRPGNQFFVPERTEKECRRHRQCGQGERCCDWGDKKHCLKAISKAPKPGSCPKITQVNDAAIAGATPCRYDRECSGDDHKCCMNTNFGYKECLSTRQNIECPQPKTFFATTKKEKSCTKDTECGSDEKCCNWHGNKHCLTGISTIPKPGFCPAPLGTSSNAPCLADYVGCMYDAECSGVNEKCCINNPDCHYSECIDMNRDYTCPPMETEAISAGLLNKASTCKPNSTCAGFGKLCCATALDHNDTPLYHCVDGEYHQPKPGQCPDPQHLADPEGDCLADYEGACEFDDDCFGEHKCCKTSCGYSECVNVNSAPEKKEVLKRILNLLEG